MAFSRRAAGSCATLFRQRSTAVAHTQYARQGLRAIRARGYASGGHSAKSSSDIPWLAGSVAVTAPVLWYIGVWQPDPNDHHEEHGDHGDENKEGSQDDGSEGDAKSESNDDSSSSEGEDTPASSDDEGEKDDGDKKGDDKKQKKGEDDAQAVKPAGDQTTTSGKQEGMANADTRHSTDVGNDPDKSAKAEGPESAKAKGTVKTDRKPAEQANKEKNA